MKQADRIRQFALFRYIVPAKQRGQTEIVLRAGDIHRDMELTSAMPAVCSAIGSNKFNELASVTALDRTGPANGANVYFRFDLQGHSTSKPQTTHVTGQPVEPFPVRQSSGLDVGDAVFLVSCVKSKRAHRSHARDLYISSWFTKARELIERRGSRWFILSALYGLVEPDAEIDPYDRTLNNLGVSDRRAWAAKVLDRLVPEIAGEQRVVILAGHRYREFLVEPLLLRGIDVVVPMQNLRQGEQLAWLSSQP